MNLHFREVSHCVFLFLFTTYIYTSSQPADWNMAATLEKQAQNYDHYIVKLQESRDQNLAQMFREFSLRRPRTQDDYLSFNDLAQATSRHLQNFHSLVVAYSANRNAWKMSSEEFERRLRDMQQNLFTSRAEVHRLNQSAAILQKYLDVAEQSASDLLARYNIDTRRMLGIIKEQNQM
ncbi:hypothetical protein BU26DRAFT_349144 [Trematosphaeria pertusa]|uniref:Uncharacterized protein n=1 Tax=Trematosphaeria pertusa TaxID=390896 RepID=A0A6A6IAB2_9PLEO|nr:uncharacterized protein BU26DRAFT_349144 [Trematosphaeria pertusa]KAF2247524.1 hypothetical protein BU26DRAFT_349144 [Trematosphaeria pertusa]